MWRASAPRRPRAIHRGPEAWFLLGWTPMGTWLIEQITTPAELDAILRIEEASFTNPWSRQMYLAELDNVGLSFLYLARDARSRPVGFCSFWPVLDELHINNLAVDPTHRRA